MRAHEALPDGLDEAEFNGHLVRKGTVAAFIASARVYVDPAMPEEVRRTAERDIVDCAPALRALGLLDIMLVRDERLRALVERAACTGAPMAG